jgi:HTH-type transcriptional regulator, glycine betaine synthesis regulator
MRPGCALALDPGYFYRYLDFQKVLKLQGETIEHDPAHEAEMLAAEAIGDVIEHWGFRRVLGRVWTVLFIAVDPLPAAAIGERLSLSSGAVSMSLTELQRWGVVRRVFRPGDRKEYFEAETDFWKMISKVFDERERLLAESVRGRLERAVALLEARPQSPEHARSVDRVKRLLSFVIVAQTALDGFIRSRVVDFSPFGDLMRFPLRLARKRRG